MSYNDKTRVIDLTVGDLLDAVETRVKRTIANSDNEQEKRQYVYGLKGLAQLLGCSKSTASRLKTSGKIDEAITQVGGLIVIDAERAIELAGNEINK